MQNERLGKQTPTGRDVSRRKGRTEEIMDKTGNEVIM
jgi:hypothetical protein